MPDKDKKGINTYDFQEVAFTWAPAKLSLYPIRTFEEHKTVIFPHLQKCCETFMIFPEFTKKGNLHYHGMLMINNRPKWYSTVLPIFNRKGFTCIKSINDSDKWYEYMSKEVSMMRIALNDNDIPLTEDNIPKRPWVPLVRFGPAQDPVKLDAGIREPGTHPNNNINNYIIRHPGAAGQPVCENCITDILRNPKYS